jgi:hypothetical protein
MIRAATAVCLLLSASAAYAQSPVAYRVLATSKTSTMQDEMNQAARDGYKFGGVMGGETSFGGNEVVVVMTSDLGRTSRYEYRLIATNRTSTMQKELQDAADAGFEYQGQTIFNTTFGGKEVVVILERDKDARPLGKFEYRLVATKKTGTLQKELTEAGDNSYQFVGLTVAKTLVGGSEVVAILRRKVK